MADTRPTVVEQANFDITRIIDLVESAVRHNHDMETQAGRRLFTTGHDFASHSMCSHYDCQLLRQLRFTWGQLRNEQKARETAATGE